MGVGLSFDSVVFYTLAHQSKPHSTKCILHDMLLTSNAYAISFLKRLRYLVAEPPTKGQPLNNAQNARPQLVHYSEVPLYKKNDILECICSILYLIHANKFIMCNIHTTIVSKGRYYNPPEVITKS